MSATDAGREERIAAIRELLEGAIASNEAADEFPA